MFIKPNYCMFLRQLKLLWDATNHINFLILVALKVQTNKSDIIWDNNFIGLIDASIPMYQN